jgi:hypothetical protein
MLAIRAQIMTLGDCPIIREVLEQILQGEMQNLRGMVRHREVRATDVDGVINEAFCRVIRLEPRGEIAAILAGSPKRQDLAQLERALTALFVHYVKLECRAYHKDRRPRQKAEQDGQIRYVFARVRQDNQERTREILLELSFAIEVDVDRFLDGDQDVIRRFYKDLARQAELSDLQAEYIRFRLERSEAREQDFKEHMGPYQITRLKQAAFDKLRGFLFGMGEGDSGT